MSLPIFPALPGLTFPVDKEASFATLTQSAPNGLEVTVSQSRNPMWKWTLIFEFLRNDRTVANELINGYTEYETMQGFQLALAGSGGVFLLEDKTDKSVGPAVTGGSTPNLQAQLQVVNDGAGNYYSPVQRNMGGQFYEDITDLNGAIEVYDNGVLKTLNTDYTLEGPGVSFPGYSFMGLVIQWVNPPTGPVTAAFDFYFRVRFAEDQQSFSQFLSKHFTVGGDDAGDSSSMVIKSARPVLA